MLPFPSFTLAQPDTMQDLLGLAGTPGSRIIAGGTDLLPNLKHRIERPQTVISMQRVNGLRGVNQTEEGVSIGTMTTLSDLAAAEEIRRGYPALASAIQTIATSTIQEMGTIGGNVMLDTRCRYLNQPDGWLNAIGGCLKCDGSVCHVAQTSHDCYAAHSADTVPVLWLMGAELELHSIQGVRRLPLSEFYADDGIDRTTLHRGEVLTRIHLPKPRGFVAHRKLRTRGAIDYPLLLCAVRREGSGARAVLSAIGPKPIAVQVDQASDLVDAAWAAAKPLNTHMASTSWRRHMIRVEVQRALEATTR